MSVRTEISIDAIQKLRRKLIVISMAVLLVLALYLLITTYYKNISMAQKQVLKRLQSITMTLAPHLSVSTHERLLRRYPKAAPTKQAERELNARLHRDPDYMNLHSALKLAQSYNKLETAMYTLVLTKKAQQPMFFFGATSAPEPYFRHVYKTYPPKLLQQYSQGGMIGPYKDKHGVWLSAFFPLKDAKGQVYAVVQADQKFDKFLQQARSDLIRDLSISLAIILALAGLFYFLLARVATEFVTLFTRNAEISKELAETYTKLQVQHQELIASQQQLVESEKMASLGRLVAGVAHEINTPLGIGVTATSHLHEQTQELQRRFEAGQMKKSDLQKMLTTNQESTSIILSNLQRAAALVKTFKQVAVDQVTEQRRQFDVNAYLGEVIASLRPRLNQTRHTIEMNFSGELWMTAYPGVLAQVITNLVMNSLMHAYEEGEEGRLILETERRGDTIHIEYSDNGKGISDEDYPHIFEPFFSTKRGQGGTGLGLHLVYNLVTQTLQGKLTCESKVGVGTMFILDLPMHVTEQPLPIQQKQKKQSTLTTLSKRFRPQDEQDEYATITGELSPEDLQKITGVKS